MKIIHVISSLTSGGAQRITVDICNKLSEDHEVYLAQISNDIDGKRSFYKNQLSPEVNYINLKGKKGKIFDFKVFLIFLKIIYKIKPDVIHSHLNITYSFIPSLIKRNNVKYFHTIHNVAEKECLIIKGFSFRIPLRFFYANNLITPITISMESKNSYNTFYKLDNSILVENGCFKKEKTKNFNNVKKEITHYKTDKDNVVFLNISRFAPQKNHKMLINVFNRLIERGEKVNLLIIGDGFDSEEGQELQKTAKEGIYFLGTKENISDYMYSCDAFCLSSLWEGLPITLIEALSAGCYPICTPAGGIPNVIKDESLGLLSKDFSEEEYHKTIKIFLKIKKNVNKDSLKDYFKKFYSINNTVSKLVFRYNQR